MSTISKASRILACTVTYHYQIRAAHSVAHIVTSAYNPLPENLSLINVVIIHRHGDRSQISREIGPNYPESPDIEKIWHSKLPIETTMMAMAAAAYVAPEVVSGHIRTTVFTGWDQNNIPYGQLTELGARQLINIGKEIRRRYVGTLFHAEPLDASTLLYCRSTNFCRTIQSLRSLLSGLLNVDDVDYPHKSPELLPTILSRPKNEETMFPGADGPCAAMSDRRAEIFSNGLMEKSIPAYSELEERMKDVLGYTERVSWLPIKEILTCYEAHGIPFPPGKFLSYSLLDLLTRNFIFRIHNYVD